LVVLIVWTYRDIEARSNSVFTQIFSTLLVVLFFIPGVLLYLLLRPKETVDEAFQRSLEEEYLLQDLEELNHCPSCHRTVEDAFVICPSCQGQLREPCSGCGRLVDLKWPVCPYCTTPRKERAELGERVEPPAPRYIAADARRRRSTGEAVAAPERFRLQGRVRASA
jgi:RNA polymerase subunit RPABC4/transcription elongation factor Spt4